MPKFDLLEAGFPVQAAVHIQVKAEEWYQPGKALPILHLWQMES